MFVKENPNRKKKRKTQDEITSLNINDIVWRKY